MAGRGAKLGMEEMGALLAQWRMAEVRRRMYRAPTPRERERWYAMWLLAQGWTAAAVGRALDRDAHTIGQGAGRSLRTAPRRWFLNRVVVPPGVGRGAASRVEVGGAAVAVAVGYRTVRLELASGAPVCAKISFGLALSWSSCLNYLHGWGLC